MSTNAPQGPDPAIAEATRPLEDAAKSLGVLLTHIHNADPSGEASAVVVEMIKGLAAVKQRLIEGPPPAPPDQGPPPPMGGITNGSPFDQAGQDMMSSLPPDQGPPPPYAG